MTHPELPSSGDHWSEPRPREIVNRLEQEDWPEFCRQAAEADALAAAYDQDDSATADWVGEQVAELDFVFGDDYCKKYCHVFGLGYNQHQIRSGIVEPGQAVSINSDSASFQGVDMQRINGVWRTLLQFHIAKPTNEQPSGMYYVPPNENFLLELVIDLGDDEDEDEFAAEPTTVVMLAEAAEAARNCVAHESFARFDPDEQRALLQEIIVESDNAIDPDQCGKNMVIESLKHYVAYDDMPVDLLDSCTDYTDANPDDCQSIEGMIAGFAYPELASLPESKQLTSSDFVYNHGAPCLKLRNDTLGRTYYIVPQSILDITPATKNRP